MLINNIDKDKYEVVCADNENFQYTGRIDFQNPKAPTFIYAGSYVKTRFEGTSIRIIIKNYLSHNRSFIGYVIDNKIEGKVEIEVHGKEDTIVIAEDLAEGVHELVIYKTSDALNYFDFYGVIVDKNCSLLNHGAKPKRRIECFGDSVSAGAVCEALDYVGKVDPEHKGEYDNAWYSYSSMTARNLNAELYNNAQGGIALFDKTGYFCGPDTIGLEFTYDKLRYNPQLGECNQWDFIKYTPHVVIMAIGQNDAHPDNYINTDREKREYWKEHYKILMRKLRGHYPNALFILITTILNHDKGWDDALDEIRDELDDSKVVRYKFKRNGCGTPGHIRIPEAKEMADELTAFIESFGEDIWMD